MAIRQRAWQDSEGTTVKNLNWRWVGIGLSLAVMVIATARYSADSSQPAANPVAPPLAIPAPPAAIAPPPIAAAPSAPPAPVVIPPQMAKIAADARDTPMDRPMSQVTKSWLGCHSQQTYQDTLALLASKNPAAADPFKGPNAACVMLTPGQQVLLMETDQSSHAAQVRLGATGDIVWTDPSALGGGN